MLNFISFLLFVGYKLMASGEGKLDSVLALLHIQIAHLDTSSWGLRPLELLTGKKQGFLPG